MALRAKTIQYPFWQFTESLNTTTGSSTVGPTYDSETITLYVAETGSRTFTNAFVEVYWRDLATTATGKPSVATQSLFLKLGNNAYFTKSFYTSISDSGESTSYVGYYDVTDYFTASFGNGISQSCQYKWNFATPTSYFVTGISALVNITYQYDDTNATIRSKTVHIPLGNTASLGTATSVIDITPILDTYCPEVSKSFDAIWFDAEGTTGCTTTPDSTFTMSLDDDTEEYSWKQENALQSDPYFRWVWIKNDMDTSTTHSLKISQGVAGKPATWLPFNLKVTYRYNHDQSDTILNCVYSAFDKNHTVTSTSDSNVTYQYAYLNIQEPAPIVTKNTAVKWMFSMGGGFNEVDGVNSGSTGTWTPPAGSVGMGLTAAQGRVDPEDTRRIFGLGGVVELKRGLNTIRRYTKINNVDRIGTMTAYLLANYYSGKHPLGDGVHNHTQIEYCLGDYDTIWLPDASSFSYVTALVTRIPTIPSDTYYINDFVLDLYLYYNNHSFGFGQNYGLVTTGSDMNSSTPYKHNSIEFGIEGSAEQATQRIFGKYTDFVNRWKTTYSNRMDLRQQSPSRTYIGVTPRTSLAYYTTYHQIAYTITGSISNYTGDGSGIIVECIESGSDANLKMNKVFQAITSTGGQFSGSVYDDSKVYYMVARQSDILLGRSNETTGSNI